MIVRAPQIRLPLWLGRPLGWVGMAVLAVAFSPIIVGVALIAGVIWLKRQVIGPTKEWSRWFAWWPVSVRKPHGWTERRWLEWVERKSSGVLFDTHIRRLGSDWEPPTWP